MEVAFPPGYPRHEYRYQTPLIDWSIGWSARDASERSRTIANWSFENDLEAEQYHSQVVSMERVPIFYVVLKCAEGRAGEQIRDRHPG